MGILKIAEYGSTKGKMIDKLNLSSAQCNKYLLDLKEAGYVAEASRLWETTDKGRQVIDACKICHNHEPDRIAHPLGITLRVWVPRARNVIKNANRNQLDRPIHSQKPKY